MLADRGLGPCLGMHPAGSSSKRRAPGCCRENRSRLGLGGARSEAFAYTHDVTGGRNHIAVSVEDDPTVSCDEDAVGIEHESVAATNH